MSASLPVLLLCLCVPTAADNVVLVENGISRCAIVAPKRILDASPGKAAVTWNSLDPAANQVRLRDAVRDLAAILQRISGAKVEIVADALPAGDKRIPLLIGELAGKALGQPA